ncbi:MAG: HlyD family efflux transporter periplasmic adaptor subunit [Actinobacteria bacterium]|nr:HlyD family efflux transporter periplasmic adaptor subunit [Actinomycetota bacterium]
MAAHREDNERDPAAEIASRLPIAGRSSWLMLAGIGLLIVAGVLWLVLGRAPDTVAGRGMIVPAQGFIEVGTALRGVITEVAVAPGDQVLEGSVVARIVTDEGEKETVVSPTDGAVASVLIRAGTVTERGTPLLTIQPEGSELIVTAFVPAGPGKRVEPGMRVRVSLASAPRSQYGTLLGSVVSVSPVPVPLERVLLVVGENQTVADFFLAEGPVLEVAVGLEPDPGTPSGYEWSVGEGPPTPPSIGTLADVWVVVADKTPAGQILP